MRLTEIFEVYYTHPSGHRFRDGVDEVLHMEPDELLALLD